MEARHRKSKAPTIALVASDDALRSSVRMLLSVSGMKVIEFRTARDYLASPAEPFGCLVVDCQLADMPGEHLCREAVRRNAHASIVVLSGAADGGVETAHRDFRVLTKPFEGERLIEAVASPTGMTNPDVGEAHAARVIQPALP